MVLGRLVSKILETVQDGTSRKIKGKLTTREVVIATFEATVES